jgi:hypothetical protein
MYANIPVYTSDQVYNPSPLDIHDNKENESMKRIFDPDMFHFQWESIDHNR